jgi:hypothetical protein
MEGLRQGEFVFAVSEGRPDSAVFYEYPVKGSWQAHCVRLFFIHFIF